MNNDVDEALLKFEGPPPFPALNQTAV